jgi:uncharacterized protein (TIGR00251 family)
MNIEVRVVPGAKKREIRRDGQGLRVKLTSRPHEGRANQELVEYLASTFSVRKSEVRIVTGEKDRRKVVYVPVDQGELDSIPGGMDK